MHKWFLTLVFALANACTSSPQEPQNKISVPVHVTTVVKRDLPRYIDSIGVLKPATFVEMRPQVSGILAEIKFVEGQIVSKGQPLFSIDPSPYEIKLLEAKAQSQRDRAALEAARKKMDRFEGLAKKDLISQQEWDELHAEVAKHAGQLQADEARVASAVLDLKNCSINAPIAGKTGRLAFHPGSLVTSSQPTSLVAIACIDCLLVEFSLTENQFLQLREQRDLHNENAGKITLEIYALSRPEISADGLLTFSDYGFDSRSGLLLMRGEIANREMQFLPGQSVKVKLPVAKAKGLLLVPEKALKINQEGPYVYRITSEGTVELCQVGVGEDFGAEVAIEAGLQPGDLIVTEGHLRLFPGVAVEVINQIKDSL